MSRVLLLLPSSTYRATDFIEAAQAVGVDLVIGSDVEQTVAKNALTVPLAEPRSAAEAIVAHAAVNPIDAIVPVDDQGVLAASIAAGKLGLAHNPPEAVRATRDKAALRRSLDGRVRQPDFRVIEAGDDAVVLAEEVGFPCVVKPVSLSASRGVIRADRPEEIPAVIARIRDILACAEEPADDRLVVEAFVPGEEVALEAILRAGELHVLAIFDKPDPLDGPFFEETIYTTPSRKPAAVQEAIVQTVRTAVGAIGLREGPVHAEARVTPSGEAVFLEVAARSIGGLCARSLRFGLGVTLEEVILTHAVGREPTALRREPGASGVMMLPIPRPGVLREVTGVDAARAIPGVVGVEITVPRGRRVEPLPEGDRYLGFLFARGDTPDQVEAALRLGHEALDVAIDEAS